MDWTSAEGRTELTRLLGEVGRGRWYPEVVSEESQVYRVYDGLQQGVCETTHASAHQRRETALFVVAAHEALPQLLARLAAWEEMYRGQITNPPGA